jgi:ABC-2 type transport system permease protein
MKAKPVIVLAGRELLSWLFSPVFYGISVFFFLFLSIHLFYFQAFFALNSVSLRPFFSGFPLAYILVIPAITMKSWAEEKRLGTIEYLFSMPLSEWQMVLGKFLSAFVLLFALVLLTAAVPLFLLPLGHFEAGVIITEYLGTLLLGAAAISFGLFFSSVSKSQAAAFLGSALILLVLLLIDRFTLGANFSPGLATFLNFFSLSFHFESFSRGLLDSRDLVFFILTSWLFLFLTTRVLLFRKWS